MMQVTMLLTCLGFMSSVANSQAPTPNEQLAGMMNCSLWCRGQDVEMLIGKIKGAKKLSAKVYIRTEEGWGDPMLEIVREWNECGDLTLQTGFGTDQYAYTYDDQKRKKSFVKKDGRDVLQSKGTYRYYDNGSFELSEDRYSGDKPGKETLTEKVVTAYNAQGKPRSVWSDSKLFGVITTHYDYDAKGHLISADSIWDGGGETKTYTNDARGNPLESVTKDNAGKTTGRETSVWDERNYITLFCEYDARNVLSRKTGIVYTYNERDHPKQVMITIFDESKPDQAKYALKADIAYEYYEKK